ncbi:MAG: polysaccharide deacetylase family protein [Candidatus Omnitrophota bacterium]
MIRKLKKTLLILCLALILAVAGAFFWLSDKYTVPIIMYHSINYVDTPVPNITSPERFAWHMEFLKTHGYRVISLQELIDAIETKNPLSRKSVVITFDDGYRDNYTHAFKVLKKYNFPATIFVAVDQIGDDDKLTWEQILEMEKNGIDIGSHTLDQTYLPSVSLAEQERQIKLSKEILEKKLGHLVCCFAYPSGGFTETIKKIVQKSGYRGACATNRGYDHLNKDVYELNRVRLSDKDNRIDYLFMKFSGYYNLFRQFRSPY